MQDYKSTLNLPTTGFPMKANLAEREPALLKQWEEQGLYKELRKRCEEEKRDKFILHDGPPYANGQLHVGHVMNKVLKDIVVKFKTLDGLDAPFVPGWDCHGLPIELNVEKKVGKAGVKISAKEFRQHCRDYAASQIKLQLADFKRLGILGDWEHYYCSMDPVFEANVIRSLGKIYENGHIQQGSKPVHWCIDCSSALAEAEVEYKDKTSPSIDVRFRAVDPGKINQIFGVASSTQPVSVIIWTTTPWTLPANQAVALSPTLAYVLVDVETEQGKESFVILESLLTATLDRYGIARYCVRGQTPGTQLEGLELHHPFYDRLVPIVLGDHVTTDAGTGCVHTAPAHGQEDYVVALKYQLSLTNPVGQNGCYHDDVPLFANLNILKANDPVIAILKEKHTLVAQAQITHSYPHCWRHKTPLVFLATPQWFISMDNSYLRRDALEEIKNVRWVPTWGQARIAALIDQRPDWCISRQRAWGVPIPFILHKKTRELHPRMSELIPKIAERVEQFGIDAWFDLSLEELIGEEAANYDKLNDVLDVWFDSGVTHECVLKTHKELQFPADLYLEGSDQHRGWFQSSLLSSIAMQKQAPFRAVLTHGYTVDGQGYKMSKSLGNIVSAEKATKTFGADLLRLWAASADYHNEVRFSDEIMKRLSDVYRRIRNTARFLLANIHDFDPATDQVSMDQLLELDRFILNKAYDLQNDIITDYGNYEFHLATQKIHHFCSIDLGSFYLDIIKDRQYTMQKNSRGRRSAQTAMYHVLQALVRWIAPILSFTAEEIYTYLPGEKEQSVFFEQWHKLLSYWTDDKTGMEMNVGGMLDNDQIMWNEMIKIKEIVNKLLEEKRKSGLIGSGLQANVILYANDRIYNLLATLGDELRFVLITSSAKLERLDKATKDAVEITSELKISIQPSSDPKCQRCWHYRSDVGHNSDHPELCGRCVENVCGKEGEKREFA